MQNKNIEEKKFDIRDYLKIILRRKWIILAFMIIPGTLTAFKVSKEIPVYIATSQVIINRNTPRYVNFTETFSGKMNKSEFFITHNRISRSRPLIQKVIDTLDLKNSLEFKPNNQKTSFTVNGIFRGIKKSIARKLNPEKGPEKPKNPKNNYEDAALKNDALINNYLSKLSMAQAGGSIININFRGTHPKILAKICNTHTEKFIETNLEIKFAASEDAIKWLQKQLLKKKESLEKAEEALLLYEEKHNTISLGEKNTVMDEKLQMIKSTLTKTKTNRIELESVFNQIKKDYNNLTLIKLIPDFVDSTKANSFMVEIANLKSEIVMLSKKYGVKHPNIIKANYKLEELKKRIKSEVANLMISMKTERKMLLVKERDYSKLYEDQKLITRDLDRKRIVYARLERDAESEKTFYDILLRRMKETDIAGELKTSNIRIIQPATVPRNPIGEKKSRRILKAIMVGLALGIGLAFFLDYLDNTVKSTEDVEHYLGVTLLGLIEKARMPKGSEDINLELIANEAPKSVLSEAIRNVRTSILFSTTDNPNKLLLVTSTKQGEGKSFIAANLAITFAQAGKNTLLVDTDFRRPRLHKIFNIDLKPGLSNHFIGEIDYESIIKPSGVPKLSIITCGIIPPNPSELLGSHSMEAFCKTVKEKFDTVIFDTPPTMTVTDAQVLSRFVDGVIFVVKSGQTVKELARRAVMQHSNPKTGELLGVILNLVDVSKGSYYSYYYSYYYKYGYGYDSDEGSSKRKKKNKKRKPRKEKEVEV